MKRCLLASVLLVIPSGLSAQELGSVTVQGWLDRQFESFLTSCDAKLPRAFRKKDVPVVPNELTNRFNEIGSLVAYEIPGQRLLRIFDTIYIFDESRYQEISDPLDVAIQIGTDRQVDVNTDNTTYTHDCLTTISAGLEVGGGFDLGFLSNEIEADTRLVGNRSNGLSVVYGTFDSPVHASPLSPIQETFYNSQLWSWYERNPDRVEQPIFSWRRVHGMIAYDLTNIMWATTFAGNAEGGGGIGFGPFRIGISGEGRAEVSGEQGILAEAFRAIVFPTGREVVADDSRIPVRLATLDAVRSNLSRQRGRVLSAGATLAPISSDNPIVISFSVDGLSVCDAGWKIRDASTVGSNFTLIDGPSLLSAIGSGLGGCRFVIDFQPPQMSESENRISVTVPLEREFVTGGGGQTLAGLDMDVALGFAIDQRSWPKYLPLAGGEVIAENEQVAIEASWLIDSQQSSDGNQVTSAASTYLPRIFRYNCGEGGPNGIAQIVGDVFERQVPDNEVISINFSAEIAARDSDLPCQIEGRIRTVHEDGRLRVRDVSPFEFVVRALSSDQEEETPATP